MSGLPAEGAGKAEWRTWARARRAEIDWAALSPLIVEGLLRSEGVAGAATVLFDPLPGEPDITSLAESVVPLLTRTATDGGLTLHRFDAPRESHPLGFSQPVEGTPELDVTAAETVLVPGLVFDKRGNRIGRGTGHYDRFLARLRPDAKVIGVTADELVVERLEPEQHDFTMTHLATQSGVVRVPRMSISDRARAWIDGDPDPDTQAELESLLADEVALAERMKPIEFGTAGIRGAVGAGPGRMNRAVVIRTTRGLADYLNYRGRRGEIVVIGFDARHDSRRFAADAIGVLRAAGLEVHAFDAVEPTPLVAHSAKRLDATAAIVITASHNPRDDNGYKVYDSNAAQIVPPADEDISRAISQVGPAADVPRSEEGPSVVIGERAEDAYVDEVLAYRGDRDPGRVAIAYTPLHGVAGRTAVRLLGQAGHEQVAVVPEQFEPDGAFPTVAFPNPEEQGALDMVEALATREGADLVLANDPDGDRLAVSVPGPTGWRRLSGNEIGVLLADFVLETGGDGRRLVVNSIVSSPMLSAVAARHGVAYATTLTGFKWICNAALDLEAAGHEFVFGYEEALGFTIGPVVRDKDGMSAAVWFADLASRCLVEGESILDRLSRLFVRDGLWVSHAVSVRRPGLRGRAEIDAAMERLVERPPATVAGIEVAAATDYSQGAEDRPRWLPAAPLLELSLADGGRVLARPSGTEPKLKIYVDLKGSAANVADVPEVRAAALALAAGAAAEMVELSGLS